MHLPNLKLLRPTVYEKMDLQESKLYDLDLGVKVTQNVAQYHLHHVTYAPVNFEVARMKILDGIHLESKRIPSEKVTGLRKSWRNTPGHVFFSKSRRSLCL